MSNEAPPVTVDRIRQAKDQFTETLVRNGVKPREAEERARRLAHEADRKRLR